MRRCKKCGGKLKVYTTVAYNEKGDVDSGNPKNVLRYYECKPCERKTQDAEQVKFI